MKNLGRVAVVDVENHPAAGQRDASLGESVTARIDRLLAVADERESIRPVADDGRKHAHHGAGEVLRLVDDDSGVLLERLVSEGCFGQQDEVGEVMNAGCPHPLVILAIKIPDGAALFQREPAMAADAGAVGILLEGSEPAPFNDVVDLFLPVVGPHLEPGKRAGAPGGAPRIGEGGSRPVEVDAHRDAAVIEKASSELMNAQEVDPVCRFGREPLEQAVEHLRKSARTWSRAPWRVDECGPSKPPDADPPRSCPYRPRHGCERAH